ncbi:MAG TPA: hypothetical protein VI431_14015 [Candidatus Acidoferrum sp.]
MAAIERQPLATTYSVEVSGWDSSHTFFVERSELYWNEETGKQLTLCHRIAPGAMIFVRLLQSTDGERAFPVAYEAEALSADTEKPQQFRLTRVVPRCIPTEER